MPADANARGLEKRDHAAFAVGSLDLAAEHPVVAASLRRYRSKVLRCDPAFPFVRMSAYAPAPQGLEDCVVYLAEGFLGADVPVIHCPTLDFRVKLRYQMARRR